MNPLHANFSLQLLKYIWQYTVCHHIYGNQVFFPTPKIYIAVYMYSLTNVQLVCSLKYGLQLYKSIDEASLQQKTANQKLHKLFQALASVPKCFTGFQPKLDLISNYLLAKYIYIYIPFFLIQCSTFPHPPPFVIIQQQPQLPPIIAPFFRKNLVFPFLYLSCCLYIYNFFFFGFSGADLHFLNWGSDHFQH